MAERARPRPRGAVPSRRAPRRGTPPWRRFKGPRSEMVGRGIAALTIAILPWVIDIPAVPTALRDEVVGKLGMGIFVIAGLCLAGGFAISRRKYEARPRFVRRAVGAIALGL